MTENINFRLVFAGVVFSFFILAAYLIEVPHFNWIENLLNIEYISCDLNVEKNWNNSLRIFLIYLAIWFFIAIFLDILLKYFDQGKYVDKFNIIFLSFIFIATVSLNYYLTLSMLLVPFGFCSQFLAKMFFATILGLVISINILRKNA